MGQVLHGSASTTQVVRRSIQRSQETLDALTSRHGIDRKSVAKWRKRKTVEDAPTGPKTPRSTVLSAEEEATLVAFRRHTLLPLDDCLGPVPVQPHFSRPSRTSPDRRCTAAFSVTASAAFNCLQRHGISRLPEVEGDKPKRQAFKQYPIGYVHIDFAEVRTEEGKLYLFVAIDRTSKVCYAELHEQAKRATGVGFLRAVIAAFPHELHTTLTDNGIQFTHQAQDRNMLRHLFDRVCAEHGIEHCLTKIGHPWTNGQVERMNRTLKEATVKRYQYGSHAELREHLSAFLLAYNYAKRRKTLRGLTPYEFVCREWERKPDRFHREPIQDTLGPYT